MSFINYCFQGNIFKDYLASLQGAPYHNLPPTCDVRSDSRHVNAYCDLNYNQNDHNTSQLVAEQV